MARISRDVAAFVHEQRLGFHATVSPDGTANVSPKGTTAVFDEEHLMFADIRSPQTLRNLEANPSIEVNVVDPILRRGYRFKGTATVHERGPVVERAHAVFAAVGYTVAPERIRAIVLIRVGEIAPLLSPSYDDGSSEADVAAPWAARFAERVARWRAG